MSNADQSWFSIYGQLVAIASGGVGMITGIGGLWMGVLGYRRATSIKTLDLRLEARRLEADYAALLQTIGPLMSQAEGSRRVGLAADGLSQSSAHDIFQRVLKADRATLEELRNAVPSKPHEYDGESLRAMEDRLVELHRLTGIANGLRGRYEKALADDEARVAARRAERAGRIDRTN